MKPHHHKKKIMKRPRPILRTLTSFEYFSRLPIDIKTIILKSADSVKDIKEILASDKTLFDKYADDMVFWKAVLIQRNPELDDTVTWNQLSKNFGGVNSAKRLQYAIRAYEITDWMYHFDVNNKNNRGFVRFEQDLVVAVSSSLSTQMYQNVHPPQLMIRITFYEPMPLEIHNVIDGIPTKYTRGRNARFTFRERLFVLVEGNVPNIQLLFYTIFDQGFKLHSITKNHENVSYLSCNACGARDPPKSCGLCKCVHYCNQECQQRDWINHYKDNCSSF